MGTDGIVVRYTQANILQLCGEAFIVNPSA